MVSRKHQVWALQKYQGFIAIFYFSSDSSFFFLFLKWNYKFARFEWHLVISLTFISHFIQWNMQRAICKERKKTLRFNDIWEELKKWSFFVWTSHLLFFSDILWIWFKWSSDFRQANLFRYSFSFIDDANAISQLK